MGPPRPGPSIQTMSLKCPGPFGEQRRGTPWRLGGGEGVKRWVREQTPLLAFAIIVVSFLTRLLLQPVCGGELASRLALWVLGVLIAALVVASVWADGREG